MSGLKKQTFVIVCNCLILTVLDLFMPCVFVVVVVVDDDDDDDRGPF